MADAAEGRYIVLAGGGGGGWGCSMLPLNFLQGKVQKKYQWGFSLVYDVSLNVTREGLQPPSASEAVVIATSPRM